VRTLRKFPGLWVCLLLPASVFAVYAQVSQFSFVNYDDPDYVRQGITLKGIRWAFTSTDAANWFPVTRLSHMLDLQLFGMDAGLHHLTSVAIHGAAAVLLFLFLVAATGRRGPSAFVAFIFALHPLHVESVAWIAERKDVLCAFFWFLALWAYVRGRRALVVVAFVLGMMSKPMIVTLPFVLLLLDFWPLKRGLRVREKLPLFAIAAAGAAATYVVQHASGAVKPIGALGIGNALVSYVTYIVKTFWPTRLAVFYPYPESLPPLEIALAAAALVAVSAAVVRAFRQRPYLATGWFWFLGTLAPVIGIVQVGAQARADRYMYVPMIGLLIMAAWGASDLLRRWPRAAMPLAVAAGIACAGAAWSQTGYWENSGTLFAHALEVTDGNFIAEHNLGAYLMDQPGGLSAAVEHLQEAVRLRPDSAPARTDLGSALARIPGRLPEAVSELRTAARLLPDSPIPHNNLANALASSEQFAGAISEYQAALRIQPDYPGARESLARITAEMHYQSGLALAKSGKAEEAVREFEEALRFRPDYAEAQNNLGVVLSQIPGRAPEAAGHFRAALRIRPDYDDARYNLQVALQQERPAAH
jgi:protein O-mannosyl-transferase